MFPADQVEEIKRKMEEEHRLDREALARLQRFLPNTTAMSNTGGVISSAKVEAGRETLIEAIQRVVSSEPKAVFTNQAVYARLKESGFMFGSDQKQSLATIATAMGKLVKRGKISMHYQGKGRDPNQYLWVS
jgi:hypothetical protein